MIGCAPTRYTDKFYFYENDQFIGQSIRLYGEYTEPEVQLLRHFITSESVVYDVGANIGYHTLAFSKDAARVYAFEPNLQNLRLLEANTISRGNVVRYNMACGHEDGLTLIGDFDVSQVGNYGKCEVSAVGTFNKVNLCSIRRIDSLHLPKPDLIKIDVEGLELQVFVGAEQTIVKHRPVIFYEAQHVPGQDQIYRFLVNSLGYALYWFPVFNYNPSNFRGNPENVFLNSGVVNILAVPQGTPVLDLPLVMSETDTYQDCVARHASRR